jgi:ATP-dependent Lhr-like helicase
MLEHFSPEAKIALETYLHSQWSIQGGIPLPGPSFIPVEIIDDPGRGDAWLIIFHSFRGGGVNFPLSLALIRDLEVRYSLRFDGAADDNSVFVRLPRSIAGEPSSIIEESLRRLSQGGKGEERFRERLESSGVFGAAFREASERSLILPRAPFGKRMPLWVIRQKSKQLFDAVSPYRDFPAAAEAWRSCLVDQFDMDGFRTLLEGIGSGAVSLEFFKTRQPSPFSKGQAWAETNALMYEYDGRPELSSDTRPSLSDQVIAEALGSAALRPDLKAELVQDFCSRLRREIPGWAPEDALTLCEWVKERIAIPTNGEESNDKNGEEWERLLECLPPPLKAELREDRSLGGKLEYITREGAMTAAVVHREWAKKWKESQVSELASDFLTQWLRYEAPLPLSRIEVVFGLSGTAIEEAVSLLSEQDSLVRDIVVKPPVQVFGYADSFASVFTGADLVCDRENLELLLRMSRRKQRPTIMERPAAFLVPFLARRQGICMGESRVNVDTPWRKLLGYVAQARLWETEFFPCRFPSYSGETLDREIREGRLLWYGAGKEKTAFCRPDDLDLVLPVSPQVSLKLPDAFFNTPRSFWEIRDALIRYQNDKGAGFDEKGAGVNSIARALWEEVWRGSLSSDSWEPLRKAAEYGFDFSGLDTYTEAGEARGHRAYRIPRALRERWRSGPPVRGNWFSLAGDSYETFSCEKNSGEELNPLEDEELKRERVRLLIDRWGLLTRPLLERELPLLSWSKLLPAMRRMELAGELVAGRFFGGVDSLQFASPRIAEELEEAETEKSVYWMNAADPASPAGLAIQGVMRYAAIGNETKSEAPIRRVPATRLCYRGAELIALSSRASRTLEIYVPPDDHDIGEVLSFVKFPRTRKVQPDGKIDIETINGKSAAASSYSSALASLGFVKDRGKMVLW